MEGIGAGENISRMEAIGAGKSICMEYSIVWELWRYILFMGRCRINIALGFVRWVLLE